MKRPIRVAMLIQRYHPHVGGAEKQLAALAPRLMARGVEVRVITRRYPGLKSAEKLDGVGVYRVGAFAGGAAASAAYTLLGLPAILRWRPDVLHAHGLLSPLTTALIAKRLTGAPVVAKPMGGGAPGDLARLRTKPLHRMRLAAVRTQVDCFVVVSRQIDSELVLSGIAGEHRAFLPNGVDTRCFTPAGPEARRELRSSLRAEEGPVAVFAGRLERVKRAGALVDLWPRVRAAQPEAALWVLGTGGDEAELRRRAGAGVRVFGAVEDVRPYLRAADVFVLPSETEGLSNALLEAMACGLPPVATSVGGNLDVIEDGRHGLLVPPGDDAALADAVTALLGDAARRERMALEARRRIETEYDLDRTADGLVGLYRQLIGWNEEGADLQADERI